MGEEVRRKLNKFFLPTSISNGGLDVTVIGFNPNFLILYAT